LVIRPYDFLIIMNGLLSLVEKFWYRYLDWPMSFVLYVASIGLYWCWMALNIDSWRWQGTLFLFRRTTLRSATDVLLISISVLFVGYFPDINIAFMPWQMEISELGVLPLWSLGPLWFCGRDIDRCLHRRDSDTSVGNDR
jgi:hypothetical protein